MKQGRRGHHCAHRCKQLLCAQLETSPLESRKDLRALQRGTLVSPVASNHLPPLSQLRLQLLQGVPAQSLNDHVLLCYIVQLSFVTLLMITVAWIQIYWCNLLGTCQEVNRELYMSSQKSTGWICPHPLSLLFVIFKRPKYEWYLRASNSGSTT